MDIADKAYIVKGLKKGFQPRKEPCQRPFSLKSSNEPRIVSAASRYEKLSNSFDFVASKSIITAGGSSASSTGATSEAILLAIAAEDEDQGQ